MKHLLLLVIILIVGCAPSSYSTTAKQNLTSAQAQATNAAIAEDDAARAAQATQQAIKDRSAAATTQAVSAMQAASSATEQARRVSAEATAQAQAAAANALTLEQARIAATATRAALDRQMQVDAQEATKTFVVAQSAIVSSNATATVVAKLQVSDEDRIARQKQDDDFTFWAGWILKGGAVLLALVAGITLIEIIRKRGSVSMVGKNAVALDGGLFGGMNVYLIEPDRPAPLLLTAPAPVIAQPGLGQHVINGDHVVDEMGHEELEDRQYWRTRCIRFLQEAISAKGKDYGRIPTATQMKKKPEDWVETTDALGQWIIKEERQPTLCIPPYENLGKLYEAVATRKISPLPPKLREQYAGNRGKQETGEQGGTAGNSGKQPVSLSESISALPQREATA